VFLWLTSLSSLTTLNTFWTDAKSGGGTILDVYLYPSRFVVWELSDLSVMWGSVAGWSTTTHRFHSVSSSSMSSLHRCAIPTTLLVRQTDRAEDLLLQLEKVILTIELLGIVFLEEEPHNIFSPFGRDQPIILNKEWYQTFFLVLIDFLLGFLGLIIKVFDNQTEIWTWLSSPLIIKLFEMFDDNHDYFVYNTVTHKSNKSD